LLFLFIFSSHCSDTSCVDLVLTLLSLQVKTDLTKNGSALYTESMSSQLKANILCSKAHRLTRKILNGSNKTDYQRLFEQLFNVVCEDNGTLDSQDSTENGIIRAIEEQSDANITLHVRRNYIASAKVRKECDQYRNGKERKNLVGCADSTKEISWKDALIRDWGPLIRQCKTNTVCIVQGWTGRVDVNKKRSLDLHCRWILYVGDVQRQIGAYFVFDLNDPLMGGKSSMIHFLYLEDFFLLNDSKYRKSFKRFSPPNFCGNIEKNEKGWSNEGQELVFERNICRRVTIAVWSIFEPIGLVVWPRRRRRDGVQLLHTAAITHSVSIQGHFDETEQIQSKVAVLFTIA